MNLRKEYKKSELLEGTISPSPFDQFETWFSEHLSTHQIEPFAMFLATAALSGAPSMRTVLLREYGIDGFVFYTNYESQKGQELTANPQAALLFYWPDLERQVRVSGRVEKLNRQKSEEYFQSRPIGAQIGALASAQSTKISSREELEERYRRLESEHRDKPIKCPDYWGGFRVLPASFEFWQGRENRLHDRILYSAQEGGWTISRLSS
jgi:pyridoxamine 5'-phosphate oxidase